MIAEVTTRAAIHQVAIKPATREPSPSTQFRKVFGGSLMLRTALLLAPLAAYSADHTQALDRQWVAISPSGKLEYKTTARGDRIMDFSHAGYMGGGVAFPKFPVKKEVAPSGGDDTAAIQTAIGEVSAMPLVNRFRGAVLLKQGIFHCSKPVTIAQDGVVLRGSGSGTGGTLIELTGSPQGSVFIIEGPKLSFPKATPADTYPITDAYVAAGTLSVSVKDTKGLTVGDNLSIRWARTAKWIQFMGMDKLVRNGKPQTWIKKDSQTTVDRLIRAIDGNRITLDVPLTEAIDAQFLDEPAVVVKTPSVKRLSQCGIESLQIISPPHKGTLTSGKYGGIRLSQAEDCWVRDIVMRETLTNVSVMEGTRRITISESNAYHSSTVEKGAGYSSDFSILGSQVLVDRCTSTGSGSFFVATFGGGARLNVALNCKFVGKGSIQPHMRWSTGLLIDSCNIPDGEIDFANRLTFGSGHGWSIGWGIAWNCNAKSLLLEMPPGALNLAIGCKGEPHQKSSKEAFFSANQPVTPASLYLSQLRERLGETAMRNIGY